LLRGGLPGGGGVGELPNLSSRKRGLFYARGTFQEWKGGPRKIHSKRREGKEGSGDQEGKRGNKALRGVETKG